MAHVQQAEERRNQAPALVEAARRLIRDAAPAIISGPSRPTAREEAYHRYRLLATMVQGTAAALAEECQSHRNVEEADWRTGDDAQSARPASRDR
jgi:hypothetical protein